jgi:CRISPR/Cas system CSM-associated protein Csm2 small subunit
MSLFEQNLYRRLEEKLLELSKLEIERIESHEKIIKIYPGNSEATAPNRRLRDAAVTAENHIRRCLSMMEFIVNATRNRVPPNHEEELRKVLKEIITALNGRGDMGKAEGALARIYYELKPQHAHA